MFVQIESLQTIIEWPHYLIMQGHVDQRAHAQNINKRSRGCTLYDSVSRLIEQSETRLVIFPPNKEQTRLALFKKHCPSSISRGKH